MTYEIRAIFENGILRPLDPISLAENDVVTVVVQTETADSQEPLQSKAEDVSSEIAQQREALLKMFAEAASLPNENPGDTFSGADHDLVLYGWKK
jgi:predicted DNA-binding antitoxin AbrB/MazE fold protein